MHPTFLRRCKTLQPAEMQAVSDRLAPVRHAVLFDRGETAGNLVVTGIDLLQTTGPFTFGSASSWVWVCTQW